MIVCISPEKFESGGALNQEDWGGGLCVHVA